MADHARFSPSSAKRWMTCPGSLALCRDLPPGKVGSYASEGTAAHSLASLALEAGQPAAAFLGREFEADGLKFVVDDAMANAVQVYLDYVRQRSAGGTLLVEQRVEFSQTIGVPGQFGTADAIVLSDDGTQLVVIDLKYGQGVQVYADANEQLMCYAMAVMETFSDILADVQEVTIVVVQPRLDHIDEWTCSVGRLQEHAEHAKRAAALAMSALARVEGKDPFTLPASFLQPSDEGCRWCPQKANCPALRKMVSALVFDDFEVLETPATVIVQPSPPVPSAPNLGELFGALGLIEDWCRAVRGETERLVMAGIEVIGSDGKRMKVVEGRRGNRAWSSAEQAEDLLVGMLPEEVVFTPRKLNSPAAIGKVLDKRKTVEQWKIVKTLIVQPPGKPKVVLGSDPSPPWTGTASASDFDAVDGED